MEKIFDKPKFCQQCGNVLGIIFWVCRSCDLYLCHDCFKKHNMNHDYLPCKTLEEQKAMALNVGMGGYGPPSDEWPSLSIDSLLSADSKCKHAENYFKENNIVFHCENCDTWLCFDCLKEHLNHGLMAHTGFDNGKKLRQIDPRLYPTNKQLSLSVNASKKDNRNIYVELRIKNDNDVPLYDLNLMYTWCGLNHEIWDGNNLETINNKDFLCNYVKKIELLTPNNTLEISYELAVSNIPNLDLSSIITIIRFRDVLEGNGVIIKESSI